MMISKQFFSKLVLAGIIGFAADSAFAECPDDLSISTPFPDVVACVIELKQGFAELEKQLGKTRGMGAITQAPENKSPIQNLQDFIANKQVYEAMDQLSSILNSGKLGARARALDIALNSQFDDLRAIALHNIVRNLNTIVLDFPNPLTASAGSTYGSIPLNITKFEDATGKIQLKWRNYIGFGQVSGLNLSFQVSKLNGSLKLNHENIFEGSTSYGSYSQVKAFAKVY